MKKEVVRYSEAFKLQVVSEIESGEFTGTFEAMTRYDIRGRNTIQRWIKKYGKNHLSNKVVIVKTANEKDQLKAHFHETQDRTSEESRESYHRLSIAP